MPAPATYRRRSHPGGKPGHTLDAPSGFGGTAGVLPCFGPGDFTGRLDFGFAVFFAFVARLVFGLALRPPVFVFLGIAAP